MSFRSFIFPAAEVRESKIILDGRESHHLVRVLRAKLGSEIELLDGKGRRYLGELSLLDAKAAQVTIKDITVATRPNRQVRLVQSIPKGKTMDLILKMATEIGVSSIQPLFTDQGEVQIKGDRLESKVGKWETTMIEACKQCGLPYLPELGWPQQIKDWLGASTAGDASLRIVASLEDGSQPLHSLLKATQSLGTIEVAVGPEGDFTPEEYASLRAHGFQPVRLGANVLRSETAAAYILSVVDQLTA